MATSTTTGATPGAGSDTAFSWQKMQPRFKECKANFDTNPKYFRTWVRLLSGIVRNISGGEPLEKLLDNFLHRDRNISSTRPAFLEHPDLDLGLPVLGNSTMETQGTSGEDEVSVLDFELPPSMNPQKYTDLDEDSIRLDKGLFNTLFTIIEGTYLHLIEDLTGEYARYTFAIIALWKHASLGSQGRRLQAMNDIEELKYDGDASKWKVDFISRTREIYSAGATIEHYIMQCAFKSFEGKNTQVQSMIAQDINDEKTIHQGMNLESLATKYSTFLATLSSQKSGGKTFSVEKGKWCSNCKMKNHNTEDCRFKPHEDKEANGEEQGPKSTYKNKRGTPTCIYCKKKGHIRPNCPLKKKHESEISGEGDANEEPEAEEKINHVSDEAIATLCQRLKNGEIKLNL